MLGKKEERRSYVFWIRGPVGGFKFSCYFNTAEFKTLLRFCKVLNEYGYRECDPHIEIEGYLKKNKIAQGGEV